MPVEFRANSKNWYGRYKVNGQRVCLSLQIPVKGTRPCDDHPEGDEDFRLSKVRAEEKLKSLTERAHSSRHATHLVERLYELQTGDKIESVPLRDLPEAWLAIPRRRSLSKRYKEQCQKILVDFGKFMRARTERPLELAQITRGMAQAYMQAEGKRDITAKTWNDTLKVLRATCKYLLPAGSINPFYMIPTREQDTVFRRPFSAEELKLILAEAGGDSFIRPIIVTGICTAMRRGDCCLLRWNDIDLHQRFITVKTSKTGETVTIPIFPLLYDAIASRKRVGEFAFPEQAAMYLKNPDGITWRVQKVLTKALTPPVKGALPDLPAEERRRKGLAYLANLPPSRKTDRMCSVFTLYMDGKTTRAAAAAAGVSAGSASEYLNAIQAGACCHIHRRQTAGQSTTSLMRNDNGVLRVQREGRTRRTSTRDFHSFRVTWVTLALSAGVPMEIVRRVTGHKTAEIVLKHYFQPGREEFRRTIQAAMPELLIGGSQTPKDSLRELVKMMTAKSLTRDKPRILELLEKL